MTEEHQITEVAEQESPTADPVDEQHTTEVIPSEPNPEQSGGAVYDAPNQQAVGQPPPWEEGSGGEAGDLEAGAGTVEETGPEPRQAGESDLDSMTKNELLTYSEEHGIDVNSQMNKDELKAAIRGG
jgi:hypothetical protein